MQTINIPSSKSYLQRVILISLFSNIETRCLNVYDIGDDIQNSLNIFESLGGKYVFKNNELYLYPKLNIINHNLNVGESGTLTRMLIPLITLLKDKVKIIGSGSLNKRKIDSIKSFLNKSNIEFISENGCIPIEIDSTKNSFHLYNIEDEINASDTSQYVSGIICCYAIKNRKTISFKVKECYSIDYVYITIDILSKFGYNVDIENIENDDYIITINKTYNISKKINIQIEGDWSSAASIILYNIINNKDNEYIYNNLNINSYQPDKAILYIISNFCLFENLGNNSLKVKPYKEFNNIDFDISYSPDLFPILCSLCATNKKSYSKITGIDRLVNKESNRGLVMFNEFNKYGINSYIEDNSIFIKGTDSYNFEVEYDSHNDHRIAMALIILRKFYGDSIPNEDKCLNKSYPNFIKDIQNE